MHAAVEQRPFQKPAAKFPSGAVGAEGPGMLPHCSAVEARRIGVDAGRMRLWRAARLPLLVRLRHHTAQPACRRNAQYHGTVALPHSEQGAVRRGSRRRLAAPNGGRRTAGSQCTHSTDTQNAARGCVRGERRAQYGEGPVGNQEMTQADTRGRKSRAGTACGRRRRPQPRVGSMPPSHPATS